MPNLVDSTAAAVAILTGKRQYQPVERALKFLIEEPDPAAHDAIVATYDYYDQKNRDGMGELRALALRALQPIATRDDVPLLERALNSYKIVPAAFNPDYMVGLRAAALYALNVVDDERASYYAIRFLVEPYASKTSGEPALTAVRVLAAQQKWLPLYQFVLGFNLEQFHTAVAAEVLSEAIANLHQLPPNLLNHLLKHCYPVEDDIIMLGVIDLQMNVHPDLAMPTLRHFIHETDKLDLFRYFVHTLAASRNHDLIKLLLPEMEWVENSDKMAIVDERIAELQEMITT